MNDVKPVHVVVILAWLGLVLGGSVLLWRYKSTPGAAGAAPEAWPTDAQTVRAGGIPTLLMFVHPQCPCSRASIGELAVILSREQGKVDAHVVFDWPDGETDDFAATDFWRSAAEIPGVSVELDRGGVEARRFDAETSGQVLLYDEAGHLRFAGGMTNARGHAGDSEGRRAVIASAPRGESGRSRAPVFGCSLDDPERAAQR